MAPETTAGHWGIWGIYEPPEGRPTLAIWEQYLKELQGVEFAKGAVPTKQDMLSLARQTIAELKKKASGMLTPSEIESLLRKDKEMSAFAQKAFKKNPN